MVEGLYPTRRRNQGKHLGRYPELSERRRAFALEEKQGKRVRRKAARMKHKASRARSRLDELAFGTFHVRSAAVNAVNDVGLIDSLLRPYAARGCDVIGLNVTKRDGIYEVVASGYRLFQR